MKIIKYLTLFSNENNGNMLKNSDLIRIIAGYKANNTKKTSEIGIKNNDNYQE